MESSGNTTVSAKQLVVLVVEDSRTVRFKLSGMIEKMGHRCVLAENGEVALRMYQSERPSLVLMDAMMPVLDGYECARRIRQLDGDTWTPIIFLSAAEADQDLERGIDAGGDDYLVKPVSYVVLHAKIRAQQRIDDMRRRLQHLSTALADANLSLEALSREDGLTGLFNRRYFDHALTRAMASANERSTPLSLLMIDVDFFKRFNDRYGHLPGDACLRRVADTLRNTCTRARDLVARYGGEEFVVLLTDTDLAEARAIGQKLCDQVAAMGLPHETSDAAAHVTISVGSAQYDPKRSLGGEQLIVAADEALYSAKRTGRNRVA